MKPKAFLDSSVLILAKEQPFSNAARIVELLAEGKLDAFISPRVVHEVMRYFSRHYTKDVASLYRLFLVQSC